MAELYDQVHQMDFDGKKYRVRVIEDLSLSVEGIIAEASDFAKNTGLNNQRCVVGNGDVFLEVEEIGAKQGFKDKLYLGMVFGTQGDYRAGMHTIPDFGAGVFAPPFFFNRYGKMVQELARDLPPEVSRKIKDLYISANDEFIDKGALSGHERRNWLDILRELGIVD